MTRGRSLALWLAALALAGVVAGCAKKKAPPKPENVAAPPRPAAVLIGSVHLAGGQPLPSYTPEQMERSVLAHVKGGTFPDICSPPKIVDRQPVRLTPDGKLIGVMVAASEFSAQPPARTNRAHQVAIKDCRLTPPLIVAQIGDTMRVTNQVNFPLLPGLGSDTFNQTLTQGQSRDIVFDTGGVKLLMCGFTAPCGRTDVIVMGHPFAAVTDDKGEFRIEDFPADETVRLNAWHPLFSESFINVRIARGETKRVELELTPVPPPPPPPKPEPVDKTKPKVMEPD